MFQPRSSGENSDTPSTSSSESKTSIESTTSDRQLGPIPISYNETFLTHLHGRPQMKILNNVSIPLPIVSDSEESTDEEQGRNTLLGSVQCKTMKMSLVKEVKDVNSPQSNYYKTIVSKNVNLTRPL